MTTTPVMTITDEQIAEIEAQCLQCDQKGGAVLMSSDSLSSLISRLRAAEKDAERYRWLRERGDAFQWENILGFDLDEYVMQENALDHAIDAAMEQSK